MIIRKISLCLLLLILCSAAMAADSGNNFSLKGAGLLSCKMYLEERNQRSNVYYMIGGWIDGFISAHNKYANDTYDIASFESSELFASVIENHCKSNPHDRLYEVINSIVIQLNSDRIRNKTSKIEVTLDNRNVRLYSETIKRIQLKLKELGYFIGEPDGNYGQSTQEAVKAFQTSLNFEASGFPDQVTLWRLLRK